MRDNLRDGEPVISKRKAEKQNKTLLTNYFMFEYYRCAQFFILSCCPNCHFFPFIVASKICLSRCNGTNEEEK